VNFAQPRIDRLRHAPRLITPKLARDIYRTARNDPNTLRSASGHELITSNTPLTRRPRHGRSAAGVRTRASAADLMRRQRQLSVADRAVLGSATSKRVYDQRPLPNTSRQGWPDVASYLWNPHVRCEDPRTCGRIDARVSDTSTSLGDATSADSNTLGVRSDTMVGAVGPGLPPTRRGVSSTRIPPRSPGWVVSPGS
jgi:hypothetical protein